MKRLWLILSLALFSFITTACEKSEDENYYDYIAKYVHRNVPRILPEGWCIEEDSEGKRESWRGNSVAFYFMDEQGNDLLDVNDKTTWPVPCYTDEYLENPMLFYEGHMLDVRKVWFHPGVGYNSSSVGAVPVDGRHIKTFPLYFQGRHYEMKLMYLYDGATPLYAGSSSGESKRVMYPHIFRWELDGHYVYSDFVKPRRGDVFVTINKKGEIVSVRSEKTASRINLGM